MEGKLGSLSIKLLIDTGASLSIISKGIFNQLSGEHNLYPMTRSVMTANDEPLTVYAVIPRKTEFSKNCLSPIPKPNIEKNVI